MLAGLLAIAIVAIRFFPETEMAKMLHGLLVETPTKWLAGVRRRHLLLACVFMLFVLGGGELLILSGGMDALASVALTTSLYLDVTLAAWTAAALASVRHVWTSVRAKGGSARRTFRRPRGRTAGRGKRACKPGEARNDGEPRRRRVQSKKAVFSRRWGLVRHTCAPAKAGA